MRTFQYADAISCKHSHSGVEGRTRASVGEKPDAARSLLPGTGLKHVTDARFAGCQNAREEVSSGTADMSHCASVSVGVQRLIWSGISHVATCLLPVSCTWGVLSHSLC
jgi:hypothetical protein